MMTTASIDKTTPHLTTGLFRLDGRIAVVTGGGGGIGYAAALAFAESGADIALVGRDRGKLERTAEAVSAKSRRALVVQADVTDEVAVAAAHDTILDHFGSVDILFNNAGVTSPKSLADLPLDEWQRIIGVSLTGAFLCSKAFAPAMIARRHGRIINMGSILSARGMAHRTAYCAAKAGLSNFGASLAFELGPHGITVNTIGATVIVTDLNRDLIREQPQLYDKVLARSAIGRLGEVEDVTGLLVFLASSASSYITGQTIFVDGGYTAG